LLVFVLATFCWTKSLLCNVAAFTGMLLYPESTLQLCSSRRFCKVFKDLFRFPISRPDDVVFRPDDEIFPSGHPSVSRSFEQFKDCIRPDVMANRPDALQFEKIPVFQHIRPDDVVIPSGRHSVFDKK
jgi:hypothetical protein